MNKPLPRSRFGAAFADGYDRIFGEKKAAVATLRPGDMVLLLDQSDPSTNGLRMVSDDATMRTAADMLAEMRTPRYGELRDDGTYRRSFTTDEADAMCDVVALLVSRGVHRTWPKIKGLLRQAGFVVDE